MMEIGYCRISTPKQSLLRQERNILAAYPLAYIVKEVYTGTKLYGRKEWNRIYRTVKLNAEKGKASRIIFDSVSRMSRESEEGFQLYQELFDLGVELIFLKEPHINTKVYRKALSIDIQMTGTSADILLTAVKEYLMQLAKEQIKLAFEQAEKEVQDLHQRTSEGIMTARLAGKQIGRIKGKKYTTRKSERAKEIIRKNCKDFGGHNTDAEVMQIAGVSKTSFYKYKSEIKECESCLGLKHE